MRYRVALVLAGLAVAAIAILALTSVGGASNARQERAGPTGQEAWALVNSEDEGGGFLRNLGFKSVTSDGSGHYCLTLAGKTSISGRVAIVAAVDSADPEFPVAFWHASNDECAEGQVEVDTEDGDTGDDSSAVEFTVLVPPAT